MAESATVVETQNAADVAFDRVSADYSDETAVGQLLQRIHVRRGIRDDHRRASHDVVAGE